MRAAYLLRVLSRLDGNIKTKKPGRVKAKKVEEPGNKEYKSKEIIGTTSIKKIVNTGSFSDPYHLAGSGST